MQLSCSQVVLVLRIDILQIWTFPHHIEQGLCLRFYFYSSVEIHEGVSRPVSTTAPSLLRLERFWDDPFSPFPGCQKSILSHGIPMNLELKSFTPRSGVRMERNFAALRITDLHQDQMPSCKQVTEVCLRICQTIGQYIVFSHCQSNSCH